MWGMKTEERINVAVDVAEGRRKYLRFRRGRDNKARLIVVVEDPATLSDTREAMAALLSLWDARRTCFRRVFVDLGVETLMLGPDSLTNVDDGCGSPSASLTECLSVVFPQSRSPQ